MDGDGAMAGKSSGKGGFSAMRVEEVGVMDGDSQGCNFGLKVRVPIQKENEAPLGPEVNGEETYSLFIRLEPGRAL